MASKLIPPSPADVMVIRNVTPNIVTCSVPFARFGRVRIGGRATIVRLTSGALAVFSPVALTPDVSAKLASMGNDLKYIAAPDMEHHIFLGEWHQAYPGAHIIGPQGLEEKRAADPEMAEVALTTAFSADNKATLRIGGDFDADFDYEFVDAHPNKELVFYYRPDRTLIQADYFFNLPATEQYSRTPDAANKGFLTKFFGSLNSTHGKALGQRRLLWYGMSSSNRQAYNASARRIDTWDFDRIIPCHGDVIETDGKQVFRKLFAWHLQALAGKST
ncbi:MAG: hypothetical protein M1818_007717 [Claussenomyces sp. TS43310]|nr:MAG: hypothetical protein M1818_007717 [Claussenomyces sp. TS43310]